MAPATSLVDTLGAHYRQLLGRWNSRKQSPLNSLREAFVFMGDQGHR